MRLVWCREMERCMKVDTNLALSKEEFIKRYIEPAMAWLAHNGLCHPEMLTAEDRAFWTNAPTEAECECDDNCRDFIAAAREMSK